MTTPRVLDVTHVITTLTTGGAERQLQLLVAASGHRSRVVCLYGGGPVADELRAAGREVHVLGMSGWRRPVAVLRLARLLRDQRPDVVHVHLLAAQLWGIPAARLARVPVVVSSEHSLMDDTIEGRPHRAWLRWLYRLLERMATHTVAVSATTAQRLARWGVDGDRVTVVENGIDVAALQARPGDRERLREEWAVAPTSTVITVVGRLDPVKRLDEVVRALAPLLRGGGHELVVAGAGPLAPELHSLARELGVAGAVHLLGARSDVAAVLAASDLLVSASRDETFGMAVVEALASGLPVVYVQAPALQELDVPPTGAHPVDAAAADHVAALATAVGIALAAGPMRHPLPDAIGSCYGVASAAARIDALYRRLHEEASMAPPGNPARGPSGGGLVLASRGDALTPYLFEAIERRWVTAGRLDVDLTLWQRALVAGATFRWPRRRWAERYFKSRLGHLLRSANATRALAGGAGHGAAVLQVHCLFQVRRAPSVLYVDCTHRQSAEHWPDWNPLRDRALAGWYRQESTAYRAADHVFAFSTATRDSLVDDYGVAPGRVSVTGCGVNSRDLTSDVPLSTPPATGGPTETPVLLFVGNDFVRKGGLVLLEAFAMVRERLPGARLLLVGDRPAVPGVDDLPGVEVLGRVRDRERVHVLYRDADVFVLPSYFDPLPLALLEAMAHGLPCVTTPTCGVPDVVTDGVDGHLVPPGDAGALADTLVRVLHDPGGAAAVGAAARTRVLEAFTWDDVVERMAPVLDRWAPRREERAGAAPPA